MIFINESSTIEEIAALVSQKLSDTGIQAILSGGAVVSIYSNNEYESKDLDFVSGETNKKIFECLKSLGFEKTQGRYLAHPNSDYYLEFPKSPLAVGDKILNTWDQRKTKNGTIQMLTPTQ